MKILFLVPYPINHSPSQRFRFEQYFDLLRQHNHTVIVQSFLDSQNWSIFFNSGHSFQKFLILTKGFLKRIWAVFHALTVDMIFIHREATPIGPPIIEWLLARALKKKIIYDFDDAVWSTDNKTEPTLQRWIKCRWKVAKICSWSYKVSCGNEYLRNFALRYNTSSYFNPTTIDLKHHYSDRIPDQSKGVTIGWTGSHSTLKYLNLIEPALRLLQDTHPQVTIVVIADRPPNLSLRTVKFVKWNYATEIRDLAQIDIGIMPLPDDEWSKGKCGFKLLQYFALKIPAIASPVGVNSEIVQHGISGFLASTTDEWYDGLKTLVEDDERRKSFGNAGHALVKNFYSTSCNAPNFLSFFA